MEENILNRYGKVIRQIRHQKDISQEALADLCGLHRTYISDIELGKRNVSLENLERIANALDISLSETFLYVERSEQL